MTYAAALEAAESDLQAAGVGTPRWDAQLLLAHAAGISRTALLARLPDELPLLGAVVLTTLVGRRVSREPLPYILGEWEFMGLPFRVGAGALIPRPETEHLVEAAVERLPKGGSVLEVGVGTGCVCLSLALQRPDARVTGLECSRAALALARENRDRHDPAARVTLVEGEFPHDRPEGPWDLLLSNPPYIPTADLVGLQPEVRDREPRVALDGGEDGLRLIRELVRFGPELLRAGGWLIMELGAGQAPAVSDLCLATGFTPVEVFPDLSGIDRIIAARWR